MKKQIGFNEQDFDEWVKEREDELFDKARFKELGKEHDYIFQTLVFMGRASQQMSLGYTIASNLEEAPLAIKNETRDIASRYHELQETIQKLS
ncbi:hypothetical protein [Niallia taxi]|uniref:hypothetical protein n=1 Tax=Niallia taxi TaxID=2499688 RepID=UPI0015F4394F|nr:hypothetical protein [Niallia taxi]